MASKPTALISDALELRHKRLFRSSALDPTTHAHHKIRSPKQKACQSSTYSQLHPLPFDQSSSSQLGAWASPTMTAILGWLQKRTHWQIAC